MLTCPRFLSFVPLAQGFTDVSQPWITWLKLVRKIALFFCCCFYIELHWVLQEYDKIIDCAATKGQLIHKSFFYLWNIHKVHAKKKQKKSSEQRKEQTFWLIVMFIHNVLMIICDVPNHILG